jgi:hypothetical protein
MRRILILAFGLVLLLPRALFAETFRVERTPEGSVRVLARILDGETSLSPRPAGAATTSAVETARRFVQDRGEFFGLAGTALGATSALESAGGLHVVFATTVDDPLSPAHGLPIHMGEVAVHHDFSGEILLVTSRPGGDLLKPETAGTGPIASETEAVERAIQAVGLEGPLRDDPRVSRVAARTASGFRPAWQVEFVPARPGADWFVLLDEEDGSALIRTNRILHAGRESEARVAVDGTAYVFDPNPVSATGDPTLRDETSGVDTLRVLRTLPELDGSGYVRGPYVDNRHLRGGLPGTPGVNEPSLHYDYSRDEAGFEEVNAYFHIDRFQRRLQNLGFTNANNRQILVDVHYMADDNSWYEFNARALEFGDGGVDDAEDEEIIIHEYGHAIHHNVIPGLAATSGGATVRALSEGWCDYFAASYGGDPCVGEWDATSYSPDVPPCLRRTDSFLVYPTDLRGEVHADGEIWSCALWAVRDSLGRDVADRLAVESIYFSSASSGFRDAGWALVLADWTLYGGLHLATIEAVLSERGLLPAGQDILLANDATATIGIGFQFAFFGVTYDSVHVGSNGNLTFEDADAAPAGDAASLAAGPPRIALYWSDLDPSQGGVEIQRAGGLLTVRYQGIPVAGETAALAASLSLVGGTNEIQMIFEGGPAADVLVGIAAGGGLPPLGADLTALPVTSTAGGVFENFVHQADANFILAGRSLRFVPMVDGKYEVRDPNRETAVSVTHFEAVAERGAVRLRWGLPAGQPVAGYRVERAAEGSERAFLGGIQNPNVGENEFLDRSVRPGTRYSYWVRLIERNGEETVIGPVSALVKTLPLALTTSNPFHPGQVFRVEGAGPGEISIAIFDVRGRRVRELRETEGSGTVREIAWRGEDEGGRTLSAGIYFVRLRSEGALITRRILLMR